MKRQNRNPNNRPRPIEDLDRELNELDRGIDKLRQAQKERDAKDHFK